jgi:hypothetical protein
MPNPIGEVLSLKPNEKRSLGKFLGKIKGIDEFLADAFEGLKHVDFLQALGDALPWAGAFTDALGEAIPPVKFVVKLFSKLTEEKDPSALAYLACTLSYQRAVEQAAKTQGPPKVLGALSQRRPRRISRVTKRRRNSTSSGSPSEMLWSTPSSVVRIPSWRVTSKRPVMTRRSSAS